jgi:hypothetical protein
LKNEGTDECECEKRINHCFCIELVTEGERTSAADEEQREGDFNSEFFCDGHALFSLCVSGCSGRAQPIIAFLLVEPRGRLTGKLSKKRIQTDPTEALQDLLELDTVFFGGMAERTIRHFQESGCTRSDTA